MAIEMLEKNEGGRVSVLEERWTQKPNQTIHLRNAGPEFEEHALLKIGPEMISFIQSDEFHQGDRFILNLLETHLISHHGLSMIVMLLKETTKKKGQFGIIPSKKVFRVIEMMRLDRIVTIYPDYDAALSLQN